MLENSRRCGMVCEDGTRTDLDFMYKTIELAINCGAKTINIPDTVGYSIPENLPAITSIKIMYQILIRP